MKSNSILILEANEAALNQLKSAIEKQGDLFLVHAGDDADAALKEMANVKIDLMIVSLFLKGADGCNVIRSVKKTSPETKIIATGPANDEIIDRAVREGASYYLAKPFCVQTAVERMLELLKDKQAQTKETVSNKKKAATVDEKISEIFISIGIPPHIKGYGYLREGIKMTIERPYIINGVTKELYPAIAKKFETTASKVERAIRHAIEVAWNRGRVDAINAIFGARIYLGSEKPTNSEFIALVADKLILENMV